MRTIVRALMLVLGVLSFHVAVFSQQVAKKISYPASPDGLIGFLEFRPSDYGSQKHPLIIFLHGIGERGNGTSQINSLTNNAIPRYCANGATMRFTVGGQTSSFVVLSPQLSTQYGYWPTFYVKEMIKYAKANLQIDPDRIYITGLSLGGGGTWRAITDADGWDYSFDAGIAAAAPVCGTQEENDYDFCNTIGANHLPIWAFHSMDDGTVGVGATQHAEILAKNCGVSPAPIFTYYQNGGHGGAWINAYDTGHITTIVNGGGRFTASPNMYEWFLSNSRAAAGRPTYTAPVANAGVAQTISLPLNLITLSGSGSGTNGAVITSYSWAKTSGPAAGVISLPLLNTSIVTGLVQGTYVFTLTVTDNHGLSSSSNVTITVNPLFNQSPSANAGNNITITLPSGNVRLDGSGSDPDGNIAAYSWTKTSGPSAYNIANAGAASTQVNQLVQGVYVFTLKVTDNAGATGSSSVTVTVNAAANQAPVSSAGSNSTITLPNSTATLDGSGSYDPDGRIDTWFWSKVSGPSVFYIGDPGSTVTTANNMVAGVYVFSLTVKDNDGNTSVATKTVTVNVAPSANQAPVSNAGSNSTITLPNSTATLDGSASYDPDGRIDTWYWSKVSGPSVFYIGDPGSTVTTANNMVAGVYVFSLQVKDDNGNTSVATKTVTVNPAGPAGNQAPVSSAGSNSTITLPNSTATLDGSGSYDPDGRIDTWYWSKVSGPSVFYIGDPGSTVTTANNMVAGVYVFSLQVKDNNGSTSVATKTVTVNAARSAAEQPIGYIKGSTGPNQACDDASTTGRFAIYSNGIAKGNLVYLDAEHTKLFDGGWNWYSFTPVWGGAVTQAFAIYPNGGMDLISTCSVAGTVKPPVAPPTPPTQAPPAGGTLLGYIKMSSGPNQACDDASSTGRIAIYGKSVSNGSIVYTDAALTSSFDGGWNWYSFTATLGGTVTQAFAVYPNGSINLMVNCSGTAPVVTPPVTIPPVVTPPVQSTLLGYIKMSTGPNQACDDASSTGRIPIYGKSISNGSVVYADAALTQKYDGGWNWYSFTPVLGGSVTQAFAIYPIGSIGLLTPCANNQRMAATQRDKETQQGNASLQENAALTAQKNSSVIEATQPALAGRLVMYPNPVHTTATVELTSEDNGVKTINLYNASGVLKAKYTWQTIKGNNIFTLKNVAGLANGLYILDIRDSNGKPSGKLKFIKM
ncbi:MAG: REJ domain-containing protein [Chitinophagaceae bacterium]